MPLQPQTGPSYSNLNQVSDITALARSYLNDIDNVAFQDVILLPLVASAYRDLQRELYFECHHASAWAIIVFVMPQGVTLIGDAVQPAAILASPNGLVLANGIVTCATATPHGGLVGMGVQIAGSASVGGTNFNSQSTATQTGYFPILSVIDQKTFTFALTGTQLSNDTGGGGTVTLNPALPVGFMAIEHLYEKPYGSTAGNPQYIEVLEAPDALPDYSPIAQLRYYNQAGGLLNFIGATQDQQCRMKFAQLLPDLATDQDYIRIRGAIDALAYMTAAIACRSRGVAGAAKDFATYANDEISKLVVQYMKPKQRHPVRRRGYGSRRKVLYI